MAGRIKTAWVALPVAIALFVGGWGLQRGWWKLPPQWDPYAPLRLEHPMTPVTRWKLGRLRHQPEMCLALLQTAGPEALRYSPLADYTPVAECPLRNVVRLQSTGIVFQPRLTLRCPFVVAWVMYERQRLQPLAQRLLGTPIDTLHHYGSFACRNVYNRKSGRRSQHATASALDIAGFGIRDGSVIWVRRDWNGPDGDKREFLRVASNAACDYFGTVLGPDYNAAHQDHFHFDTARFGVCR